MKTVRMIKDGPNGNYRAGQVVAVDDRRAWLLIKTGYAEFLNGRRETAMVEPPEKREKRVK